jgi:hypothetical protein
LGAGYAFALLLLGGARRGTPDGSVEHLAADELHLHPAALRGERLDTYTIVGPGAFTAPALDTNSLARGELAGSV